MNELAPLTRSSSKRRKRGMEKMERNLAESRLAASHTPLAFSLINAVRWNRVGVKTKLGLNLIRLLLLLPPIHTELVITSLDCEDEKS